MSVLRIGWIDVHVVVKIKECWIRFTALPLFSVTQLRR
jgi:hypothetical protein